MKPITLLTLLLFSLAVKGQTITPSIERNLISHTTSYSLTAGTINDKNDVIQGGVVIRQQDKLRIGLRSDAQIGIVDGLSFNGVVDIHFQDKGNFIEPAFGLLGYHRGIQVSALYKPNEFDGKGFVQDCVVISVGYRLRFNN